MSVQEKYNIETLGIPKVIECPNCKKKSYYDYPERANIADCMMANGAGLWSLVQCKYCGFVSQTYPTAINGIKCSKDEVEQLYKVMQNADEIAEFNLFQRKEK